MTFFYRMHKPETMAGRIGLAQGEILEFKPQPSLTVECLEGEVWITRDNDPADYILAAGDRQSFQPAVGLVVEALREARLAVSVANERERRVPQALPGLAEAA